MEYGPSGNLVHSAIWGENIYFFAGLLFLNSIIQNYSADRISEMQQWTRGTGEAVKILLKS